VNRLSLLVASALSLLVVLTLTLPQHMVSPGGTIEPHAEFASDCFACHTPFGGSEPERCIACHTLKEIGIKSTQGEPIRRTEERVPFHQQLIEADCVACHSEHQGVAPFRPASQFSHDLLKPELKERCSSCHTRPEDKLHRNISQRCSECHAGESWDSAQFDHTEYFRFDRHHDTSCETCHENSDYSQYTCYGCHEHSPRNVRGEHLEEGIVEYEICVECHRSGDEHEAERIWRSKRYQQKGEYSRSKNHYRRYEHHKEDDHDD
jgi:hypothetical protein